ncbi:MAG: hypothetical protein ACREA0_19620, partial [bacterium]
MFLNKSSASVGKGLSTTVIATYNVGAAGSGTLTLTATGTAPGSNGFASDNGSFSITSQAPPPPPPPPQIAVTPDAGTTSAPQFTPGNVVSFAVSETGGGTGDQVSFTCTPTGNVTGCTPPGSIPLSAGGSANVSVSYSTGAVGSGSLVLTGQGSSSSDNGAYSVTVTDNIVPEARLLAPTAAVYVASPTIKIGWCDNNSLNGSSRSIKVNGVDRTSSFDYVTGSEPADCTVRATSTTSSVSLSIGSNVVAASICDNAGNCISPATAFTVTRLDASAPVVALLNHNRDNVERSLCLAMPAGGEAMIQCGDLVMY